MEKSDEVKELIKEMYNNFYNIAYVEKHLHKGDDFLTIGTDESEWVKGYEKFMVGLKNQAQALPDAKVVKSDPEVFVEGTVAWFNDQVILTVNKGEVKMRVTGVFHKEGENWKLFQQHASLGTPNVNTAFGDVKPYG